MLRPVGALWKKEGAKGEFLSGDIDAGLLGKIRVLIFPNNKQEEHHPDYRMFLIIGEKAEKEKEEEPPF